MIDRQHGGIVFECDACDATLETEQAEWDEAFSMFKREGWKSEKVGDEWTHLCPDCR